MWDKYCKFIQTMYEPVTDALVEDARVNRAIQFLTWRRALGTRTEHH
jgi:hypothetical protein